MFTQENFNQIPRLDIQAGTYPDDLHTLGLAFKFIMVETRVARCCNRGGRQFVEGGRLA
ncbi:hypothetical protein D3C81_970120 [compost metagenome]